MGSLLHVALFYCLQLIVSGTEDLGKCCRKPDASTIDCSFCRLEMIPLIPFPNITRLFFNDNLITNIEDFTFAHLKQLRYLNVRNNRLAYVGNESFAGLENLETLDITQEDGYVIPPMVFKPLTTLTTLKLGNIYPTLHYPFPHQAFTHLTSGLKFLEFSVTKNFVFGQEFAHLKKLETLVLYGHSCDLRNISSETFAVFADSLQTLEVHDCKLVSVKNDSLKSFQKLKTLNVACNKRLRLDNILEVVKLMPSSSLTTLIADGVHSRSDLIELDAEWFNSSRLENLRRLSLRQTNVIVVDFGFVFHVPKLEFLNIGYNAILNSVYNGKASKIISFIDKGNLTSLDISYVDQPVSQANIFRERFCREADIHSEDFFRESPPYIVVPDHIPCCNHSIYIDDSMDDMVAQNIPQSLLFVYASTIGYPRGIIKHDLIFNADNNVLFLDLSSTRIRGANGKIKGLLKLQGIDLSGCGMEFVHPELLDYMPSLTYLNMSGNELLNTPWDRFFKYSRSIRLLDLSSNRLQGVPEDIFSGLPSLETVLLVNNPLGQVTMNLDNNNNLTLLDMRNTSLSIKQKFLKEMDRLQDRVTHSLKLMLEGNVFQCDCNNIDLLKWLNETTVDVVDKHTLQCDYRKKLHFIVNVDLDELESSCTDQMRLLTILLTPFVSLVAVLVLIVLVHNYRWSLKWRFYLLRRVFHHKRLQAQDGDEVPLVDDVTSCHAFVSHHHSNDYVWVLNSLLPKVEQEWGLRLCLGQRDFLAGMAIAENICEAIDKSRYVILVITPSFVSSQWCDFEMHMALVKGRRHLVIIYKEVVDTEKMSKTLRALMSSVNYIEYSDTPSGNALFWTRLKDRLTSHIQTVQT